MLEKNSQLRAILTALVVVAVAAVVLSRALTAPANAGVSTVSVIVELRDEPGAVYKARTEKSGGTVSQDQLRAYRDGLTAKQNAFMTSLAGKGISATIVSRDVKNYDGNIAATMPLRYSLVYNGMAMKVNENSISALRNMPEVKSVHADETLITSLNNSVSYIGAPKVYGNAAELTQFDTLNEGYEGQGMYVSIIDTGIDWTHPMFGGDPTPPRLAVMPAGPTQANTNKKVVYYLPRTISRLKMVSVTARTSPPLSPAIWRKRWMEFGCTASRRRRSSCLTKFAATSNQRSARFSPSAVANLRTP